MARLYEHQGKRLLADAGVPVPAGLVITQPNELGVLGSTMMEDRELPRFPVVLKAQVWTTSRFEQGLIQFADSLQDAKSKAAELLTRTVNGFPVTSILVEEDLEIERELFFSYFIDDVEASPAYIFSTVGGSGIEATLTERPDAIQRATLPVGSPLYVHRIRETLRQAGIHGKELVILGDLVRNALRTALRIEARTLEINPIVLTRDGRALAADCRITVDDNAVQRHPELGIDIARELANPPTHLDRIAYEVERNDYRGTFYFAQLAQGVRPEERYVGFHGSGGGGSMMSMDALMKLNFKPANFSDTSGNPPASKVYRAARIIAAQEGIVGYFGSGSGVASQEQIHSARGLVKAFREIGMDLPVVMRLGGNMEDEAVRILEEYTRDLPGVFRGFTKDASVEECAEELDRLVADRRPSGEAKPERAKGHVTWRKAGARPTWLDDEETYRFDSPTGRVHYHHPTCLACSSKICVSSCVPQILKLEDGKPVLAISEVEAAAGKCIECLACQVECQAQGNGGGFIDLPIPGLSDGDASQ